MTKVLMNDKRNVYVNYLNTLPIACELNIAYSSARGRQSVK